MKTGHLLNVPIAVLLTCTGVLARSDAVAAPGGLNLGWNDCGGLPASLNETFACNTNVGNHTLVASFVTPCCVTAMSADETVIDVQTAGSTLAPWWSMRASSPLGCRNASLSQSPDFTAGPFTCHDYWQGGASAGVFQDAPVGNRVRIKAIAAIPAGSPLIGPIPEGTEVYSQKVLINNARTVGPASCAGCQTGACLVLNSIRISQPIGTPGGFKFVSSPATRAFVTWQGGTGSDCYGATPARNVTWGSIKANYR